MEAGFIPADVVGKTAPSVPVSVAPSGNVVRAPGLKRGKMEAAIGDRIKLESVLGLTVNSNAALDCDPNTELVAYPAGCTVVLYNVRKNRQSHILNASRKSVTCVAFSPDGRYLVTGECGHAPAVRVWDLQDPSASGAVQIAEFFGHTHGVSCVAFSKSSKYLVSVGSQHDMIVNVWDWRANLKLASNKVSSRVMAVSFSEIGNYFVTVGFRHVKFWYLDCRNAKIKEPVPLMGRSAILGEQKDNEFCDVVCGRGATADCTYAITRSGLLCEFNDRRVLHIWVELRTSSANCIAIGSNLIFVGCAEGIVRCFSPESLAYVTTLPRTHYLGVDVAQGFNIDHMFSRPPNARYPDAVALTYDDTNHKLTCVYNDHSLYVWNVKDIQRVGKSYSALYHSACIWAADIMPDGDGGTLITCGSDDTVRIWRPNGPATNVYTKELQKILYIDPELKFLKDADLTATSDKGKSYDDKTGVRCVRVSPDGLHIASGDRAGNVFIHDAAGTLLNTLEAHDGEVLCLEYSAQPKLLASASRDRLIHVFLVDEGYQILQTLDDHSSSITAVRFLSSSGGLQMVSCGADKTILFRQLRKCSDGSYQFARGQNVSGRATLYDMEVDAGGRHILTACQDRNVRVYNAATGRHTKTFRGTTAVDGTIVKLAFDSSGIYLATSSTDKILSVYDYYSGECMATMYGHSEIVTGLRFTPDCQRLLSASGDGCIFVWRVPHDMVVTMQARLAQQAIRHKRVANGTGLESEGDSHCGSPPPPTLPDYTLRIGKLPSWAQKVVGDSSAAPETAVPHPPEHLTRGKWSTRLQPDKRVDSDGSKDSSLDSGTDTRYVEKRKEPTGKQRPKSLNLSQLPAVEALFRTFDMNMRKTYDILTISPRFEKDQESTEHDGDIEDISDGERTSSSESPNRNTTYYPDNQDAEAPSKFLVKSIDAAELRKSLRRARGNCESPRGPVASLTGSPGDSDDEVSTPSASGDNVECIDLATKRELYVKSAFDSLCVDEMGAQVTASSHNNSISSQHLSRTPVAPRPAPAPRATGKLVDPDAQRQRDELKRRIMATKKQLENVAFRSNLKGSQSTTDLSYNPDKDRRGRPASLAIPSNSRPYGPCPEENFDSLNSNYFDSLNYQNIALDYKNRTPYNIPANLNHKMLPGYFDNPPPYIPPHANLTTSQISKRIMNYSPQMKPMVFKEQAEQKPLAFTVEFGNKKTIQSKVYNRLFPSTQQKETIKPPSRNYNLNLTKATDEKPVISKPKPNVRSIFKNYKSCPVSPVSEECKWADKARNNKNIDVNNAANARDPKKRNSLSFFIGMDDKIIKEKRKSIVNTIKTDTERMIAEITEKYGDLDEYEPRGSPELDMEPTRDIDERHDGNFSSDSLEDCSLSQDASCKNKLYSKKICKKHMKSTSLPRRSVSNYEICGSDKPTVPAKPSYFSGQKSSTLPRNMPSDLEEVLYEDYSTKDNNMHRCQSVLTKRCVTRSNESVLSDHSNCSSVSNEIFVRYGNEAAFQQAKYDSRYNLDSQNCSFENINEPDQMYLDNHRHSSASFFLNQKHFMKNSSQESVLSNEMFLDNDNQLSRTNCNSLESVLSDDSEYTKSAPLEMLFEGAKSKTQRGGIPRSSKSCYELENQSKSYGSSPNYPSFAGMYNSYLREGLSPSSTYKDLPQIESTRPPTNAVYGFQIPSLESSGHKTVTRSKSLFDPSKPPPAKNIAYYFDGNNVQQYSKDRRTADDVHRYEQQDYVDSASKSLQSKCIEKFEHASEIEGCDRNTMDKSKSCCFEVVLEPASKPNPIRNLMEKRNSHVQKNLEKFEKQIRKNAQTKIIKKQLNKDNKNADKNNTTKSLERDAGQKHNNSKVTMEFVPHKPPKPIKRTSSVKINNRLKAGLDKKQENALSTSISSQYKAKLDGLQNKNYSKRREDKNSNIQRDEADLDNAEKTFDVYVKEKDINENRSEMQMDSLEVYAMQRMERMKEVSVDSLDVIDDNPLAKDSLGYYAEPDTSFAKLKKEQKNMKMSLVSKDVTEASPGPSRDLYNTELKEKLVSNITEEIEKYKYLERKIEIINKLVEMEERKILQEKILKEWRMRPLKANLNDSIGVVKVLSRKFEKLATKQTIAPNLASMTLEEIDTNEDSNKENMEIKRNLSLPDILNSEQIGELDTDLVDIRNVSENTKIIDKNEGHKTSNIENLDIKPEPKLNNTVKNDVNPPKCLKTRLHNEVIIPKTDLHLDSENYESSTTSSSCTNSPKRLTMYGFNRPKIPLQKIMRVPTPRLCMEHRFPKPILSGGIVRGALARRVPLPSPMLPSKLNLQARTIQPPSDAEDDQSGMRRAISLSDLAAKPMPAPRSTTGQPKQPTQNGSCKSSRGFIRPPTIYNANSNSNMTRSSSAGVLNNFSDSESDAVPSRRASSILRPTISSMNKQTGYRRRGLPNAYSAVNLATGNQEESSSEADEREARGLPEKPAVPPRPRAPNVDHGRRVIGRSTSPTGLSAKAREVTTRLSSTMRQRPQVDAAETNLSSSELCSALTEQLTKTASKVVQLYRSLQREPGAAADISGLEAAILETQKVLGGAVTLPLGNGCQSSSEDNPEQAMADARQRLEHLVAKEGAGAEPNPAMSMIEHYSDVLFNIMQRKMMNQFPQPHSLPPNSKDPGAGT